MYMDVDLTITPPHAHPKTLNPKGAHRRRGGRGRLAGPLLAVGARHVVFPLPGFSERQGEGVYVLCVYICVCDCV